MIARFRAWFDRSGPTAISLDEAIHRARIAELEQQLSTEKLLTQGLTSDIRQVTSQAIAYRLRAETAEGIAARLKADTTFVQAERCECGGDTELYWRTRAVAAEGQARQDRDNAVRLADEVARLQLIADEAERLHHIVEQLERAG